MFKLYILYKLDINVYGSMKAKTLYGRPPHFGLYISYYTASFCHGYMVAGPRYGICPYQLAGALFKHIHIQKKTHKLNDKNAKILKKVTICIRA